ncbi:hypothetical protein Desku_2898 [Desulfofundulus kuznetsovii DSM 6115]|uniref:Uncharacterized protein n=1 Tax=Desulfofundulus kuznetsovii (strain DSM 6115 / VKM B-1805 / 17) TaxID=760568 RepID=A0AAU8PYM8_DESK7|nr:hypothetical protein Desku_2898 [Desulfofundulus kuznetsovii DSM 6115]
MKVEHIFGGGGGYHLYSSSVARDTMLAPTA